MYFNSKAKLLIIKIGVIRPRTIVKLLKARVMVKIHIILAMVINKKIIKTKTSFLIYFLRTFDRVIIVLITFLITDLTYISYKQLTIFSIFIRNIKNINLKNCNKTLNTLFQVFFLPILHFFEIYSKSQSTNIMKMLAEKQLILFFNIKT